MGNARQRTIRLLIANEHEVIREGLRAMLIGDPEIELVGSAATIQEVIRLVGELEPDVLLLDPHPSKQNGLRAIELIHGEWPQVTIVAFTAYQHKEHILPALYAGVCAYLTLHTERTHLLNAIRAASHGHMLLQPEHVAHLLASTHMPVRDASPEPAKKDRDKKEELTLTERECEVLHGVAHGERNKEIAARLGISEPTVKSHLANVYFKLNVDSRASAVAVAIQRGILSLQRSPL